MDLLQFVEPDCLYHRAVAPDENNALPLLQRAAGLLDGAADVHSLHEALMPHGDCCGTACSADAWPDFPLSDASRPLCDLLDRNAPAIALAGQAIERGQLQFPQPQGFETFDRDMKVLNSIRLRDLCVLITLEARRALSRRDFATAGRLLSLVQRLGDLICHGDGLKIHYLIGLAIQKSTLSALNHFLPRHLWPRESLELFASTLHRSLGPDDGLIQSLRIELCCLQLVKLARLPEAKDLDQLVDRLWPLLHVENGALKLFADAPSPDVEPTAESLERRRGVLYLLNGHPDPLDKAETTRMMSLHTKLAIAQAQAMFSGDQQIWARHSQHIRDARRLHRRAKVWPNMLVPDVADAFWQLDLMRAAENEPSALTDPDLLRFFPPVTDAELVKIRRRMRALSNPIGLMLADAVRGTASFENTVALREAIVSTLALATSQLESRRAG